MLEISHLNIDKRTGEQVPHKSSSLPSFSSNMMESVIKDRDDQVSGTCDWCCIDGWGWMRRFVGPERYWSLGKCRVTLVNDGLLWSSPVNADVLYTLHVRQLAGRRNDIDNCDNCATKHSDWGHDFGIWFVLWCNSKLEWRVLFQNIWYRLQVLVSSLKDAIQYLLVI